MSIIYQPHILLQVLKCLFLFVMKEVITCCLYSLQWWAICILADPPAPLNMLPDIKSNMKDMRIDIVLRPRYETLDKMRFVCSGLRILEFLDFHIDLRLRFLFPLDHWWVVCFIQLLLDGLVMKCLWRINKVLTAPFYGSLQ